VFDPTNEAFHLVSIRIQIPVVRPLPGAIALRRDDDLGSQRFDAGDEPVGIVPAVRDNSLRQVSC